MQVAKSVIVKSYSKFPSKMDRRTQLHFSQLNPTFIFQRFIQIFVGICWWLVFKQLEVVNLKDRENNINNNAKQQS